MTCPDFENKVYLYLSGELDPSEKNDFKNHFKKCETCAKAFKSVQRTWFELNRLPLEKPDQDIKQTILEQSKKMEAKTFRLNRLSSWINEWIIPRKWLWGMSTVAVAVLLIFFITHPFGKNDMDKSLQEQGFEWEDDFLSQADWLDNEINRMESGQFLTGYISMEEEPSILKEPLSPMNEDLNWIREQVEDLIKTIYGI